MDKKAKHELRKKIGERMNEALKRGGKKQKELAAFLGVSDNVISYFVSGKRTPNTAQIVQISKFFNTSTDFLLGECDFLEKENVMIKNITGLSERSIATLKSRKDDKKFNNVVNVVIKNILPKEED